MPEESNDHYYTENPKSTVDVKKMFDSVSGISLSLSTSTGVFATEGIDKGTKILIENLKLPSISTFQDDLERSQSKQRIRILDLGAGYGPITCWLWKKFQSEPKYRKLINQIEIYASEINSRALWLLNRNILANRLKNVEILKGDFLKHAQKFKQKGVEFNAVYTNPPLKVGHDKLLMLFEAAMELLRPDGFIQYVHKKSLGAKGFLNKLKKIRPKWHYTIIRKISGYFVIIVSPMEFAAENKQKKYTWSY